MERPGCRALSLLLTALPPYYCSATTEPPKEKFKDVKMKMKCDLCEQRSGRIGAGITVLVIH